MKLAVVTGADRNIGVELQCCGHDETVVVVSVLTDEIHPTWGTKNAHRGAEPNVDVTTQSLDDRIGLHGRHHSVVPLSAICARRTSLFTARCTSMGACTPGQHDGSEYQQHDAPQ